MVRYGATQAAITTLLPLGYMLDRSTTCAGALACR